MLDEAIADEIEIGVEKNNSYVRTLESKVGDMSMQAKSYILSLLKEKDDNIKRLQVENSELRRHQGELSEENLQMKHKLRDLDRAVTDTFASLSSEYDGSTNSVEEAIQSMKTTIQQREKELVEAKSKVVELAKQETEVRGKLTFLTEENMRLNAEVKELKSKLAMSQTSLSAETSQLQTALTESQTKAERYKKKFESAEMTFKEAIHSMKEEIVSRNNKILDLKKGYDEADRERLKAREELNTISNRTRKLLVSLGLANECDSVGLALDHARDMVYTQRRRKGSLTSGKASNGPLQQGSILPSTILEGVTDGQGTEDNITDAPEKKTPPKDSSVLSQRRRSSVVSLGIEREQPLRRCARCNKLCDDASNFEGACMYHLPNSMKLYPGTEMEVWSCCKSKDTAKGCKRARHLLNSEWHS